MTEKSGKVNIRLLVSSLQDREYLPLKSQSKVENFCFQNIEFCYLTTGAGFSHVTITWPNEPIRLV